MNKHVISLLAIAGLGFALAAPAHAHPDNFGFVVRVAPSYHVDRYYDGSRRHERDYRDWRRQDKKHRKMHRRLENAHERWHRHNDRRRDGYYHHDHRLLHLELGFSHHDFHSAGHRHH